MLQITKYNKSLKLGLQKKARTFSYDWKGMGARKGSQQSFASPFWKLGLRTKNF